MADRRRRGLTAFVLALAALAVMAGGGAAQGERVTVRATATFEKRGYEFAKLRLRITRNGTAWRSRPLGSAFILKPQVHVRDLDADGEPEVWLDTYTGGAHCCLDSRFFRWLPARRGYASTRHAWRDVGYRRLRLDADSRPELVSADARFAYEFTAFAASAFPVQIWRFERGRLVDVTASYPSRIERDADELWRLYLRYRPGPDDPRGVLAAWVADQYLLGRGDEGWATLERLRARGAFGPRPDLAGWPQGKAYLRALRTFLVKLGYTS
jgi:hypothetical protein